MNASGMTENSCIKALESEGVNTIHVREKNAASLGINFYRVGPLSSSGT